MTVSGVGGVDGPITTVVCRKVVKAKVRTVPIACIDSSEYAT